MRSTHDTRRTVGVTRTGIGPLAALAALAISATVARADEPLSADSILDPPTGQHTGPRLESLRVRYTHYEQDGHGYQSQADPMRNGAGSERLTIEQPQIEAVIRVRPNLTTRLWLPLDVVTSASADAIDRYRPLDAMSSASRVTESGNVDSTTTYQAAPTLSAQLRAGFHIEENFRSWNFGVGVQKSFAEDNTVVSGSFNQVVDWLDAYNIVGDRISHYWRSSTNANLGLTQLLSPTTVASVNYGLTVQDRHLGTTWPSVPLDDGKRGPESFPELRQRHAFVGRLVQKLPWSGASIKGSYRFYLDDWGLTAHSADLFLYQRITSWLYVRGYYRFHQQSGVRFFTTRSSPASAELRTADSDLAPFFAHTIGAKAVFEVRLRNRIVRAIQLDLGYERYMRTNDLTMDSYSCGTGFRF